MRNEAWSLVSERVRRFEQGRLPLSQLVDELTALRPSLDPPRESWADKFDLAVSGLERMLAIWRQQERMRQFADAETIRFPCPPPGYKAAGVSDLVDMIARLVRHPDEA